jgi:hypothetical protein
MEREDDVIELGAASIETKGGIGLNVDLRNGQQPAGLAED